MANMVARLQALERRAVAAGKVKRPERDWRASVAPGMADRMHRDAAGWLWYQPTDFEAQEIEAILTEAYRMNGHDAPRLDDDDTWEPGYLPEPEPKDFLTKH